MSATNRATLINKTAQVLKKNYKPVLPPADRSVLEHLLYACCLENSPHQAADDAFAKLQENYFDWNEVRVTTLAELAEVMAGLTDPGESAQRLKRCMQSVFEAHYTFDIDFIKKQNLGKAVKDVECFGGVTSFVASYVAQNALGGHSIPVNSAVYEIFIILGIISESEAEKRKTPGLERTIAKSKGVEFGSLLHQLAVDFRSSPHSPRVRSLLLDIAPDAKDRLPKRATKKAASKSTRKKKSAKTSEMGAKSKKKTKSKGAKKSTSKKLARKKPR